MISFVLPALNEHEGIAATIKECFEAALSHLPRYVANAERGAGFAEAADAVLKAR